MIYFKVILIYFNSKRKRVKGIKRERECERERDRERVKGRGIEREIETPSETQKGGHEKDYKKLLSSILSH